MDNGEERHESGGGTERRQYDWTETDPSMAAVETVAATSEKEPTELEALFEHVDPDALDVLLRSSIESPSDHVTTVAFTVAERRVTVGSDGFVVVAPTDPEE